MVRHAKGTSSFATPERIALTPELLEGFVEVYLMERFDSAKPIPPFHRELWQLLCSDEFLVAAAAPRGHAKSSAGTQAFGLASVLFGTQDYVMIIGSTERAASSHLADMAVELNENEGLVSQFRVKVITENSTELVCKCGNRDFCITVRGAEQKVRGVKWRNRRPGLILIDDLEEDEAVMNPERRTKLREWMYNAVIPLGSDSCKIRMLGTILHFDSLLERVLNDNMWISKRFSSHKSFDDFSEILWPEKFPESRLRLIRQLYINANNPSGYAQEYLNHPIAEIDSYFRGTDFTPMTPEDQGKPMTMYIAGDLAVSKKEKADRTAFVVGGVDSQNFLHIVDVVARRMDSLEIIEEIFRLHSVYKPESWLLERGMLGASIESILNFEMVKRGIYMNIIPMVPIRVGDKMIRARAICARMRAHGVKFDKEAEWYPDFEQELLYFPRGSHDDRVDAIAWLGLYLDEMQSAMTIDETAEEEWEEEVNRTSSYGDQNRNSVTGY